MCPNEPAGSIFWFEIPYVPAGDRGSVLTSELAWSADDCLSMSLVARMLQDSYMRRGSQDSNSMAPSPAATPQMQPGSSGPVPSMSPKSPAGDGCGPVPGRLPSADRATGPGTAYPSFRSLSLEGVPRLQSSAKSLVASDSGPKRVVLLIEDDVTTRRLMVRGLEKGGFCVVQACNGVY